MKAVDRFILAALLVAFLLSFPSYGQQAPELDGESLLANLRELGETTDLEFEGVDLDEELPARVKVQIEANPSAACDVLKKAVTDEFKNIEDPQKDLKALDAYLWGLGFTKDPRAVETIVAVLKNYRTATGFAALGRIGNESAMEFLLKEMEHEPDPRLNSEMLLRLAEKKYAPVMAKTENLFKSEESGFQLQVIFGMLGDAGVPFLLQKVNDPNRIVRLHAIFLLGLWICPVEAAAPLKECFSKEPDAEIRQLIVMSLQRLIPLAELSEFLRQINETEEEEIVKEAIQGAEDMLQRLEKKAATENPPVKPDKKAFAEAVESYRKDGLHVTADLLETSTVENEPELEALREEELRRTPLDDAVVSYGKITEVIVYNRIKAQLPAVNQPKENAASR